MEKKHLYSVLMIVAVVAGVAALQKHVVKIPVIGPYLPGGATV